jgi:hypothetical protein
MPKQLVRPVDDVNIHADAMALWKMNMILNETEC